GDAEPRQYAPVPWPPAHSSTPYGLPAGSCPVPDSWPPDQGVAIRRAKPRAHLELNWQASPWPARQPSAHTEPNAQDMPPTCQRVWYRQAKPVRDVSAATPPAKRQGPAKPCQPTCARQST